MVKIFDKTFEKEFDVPETEIQKLMQDFGLSRENVIRHLRKDGFLCP